MFHLNSGFYCSRVHFELLDSVKKRKRKQTWNVHSYAVDGASPQLRQRLARLLRSAPGSQADDPGR